MMTICFTWTSLSNSSIFTNGGCHVNCSAVHCSRRQGQDTCIASKLVTLNWTMSCCTQLSQGGGLAHCSHTVPATTFTYSIQYIQSHLEPSTQCSCFLIKLWNPGIFSIYVSKPNCWFRWTLFCCTRGWLGSLPGWVWMNLKREPDIRTERV